MDRYSPKAFQAGLEAYNVDNCFPERPTESQACILRRAKQALATALKDWGEVAVKTNARKKDMQDLVASEERVLWEMHCNKDVDVFSGTHQMMRAKDRVTPFNWARLKAWEIARDIMFKN